MRPGSKRTVAIVLGVLLLALIGLFAATQGLGQPSVPSADVARVTDASPTGADVLIPKGADTGPGLNLGTEFGKKKPPATPGAPAEPDACTQDDIAAGRCPGDFNRALAQAALRQNLKTLPKPGTPEYDALRNQALGDLLDIVWIEGEAADRGVTVSDREVQQQLAQIKKQNFPTQKEFDRFLRRSGFTPFDVELRVRLQLLSEKIQQSIVSKVKPVTPADVEKFYNANKKQFEQPPTRDAYVIINSDPGKLDQAKAILEKKTDPATFKTVAKKYSTDPVSKSNGGLRQNIVAGSSGDDDLDKAVFSAPAKTLIGPVKTQTGYALVYVTKITPGKTQELKAIQQQLQQQLTQQAQQEAFASFIEDYRAKWTARTFCAKGYIFERCDNAPSVAQRAPGAPPVIATRPVAPGQAGGLGQPAAAGKPQGPHPPGTGAQAPGTGLPPGVVPGGAGAPGATGAPPPGAGG